ncbi:Exodeoxyribonuclease 7 large subunit (modular protein) [Cupriavidus neocaledonicus]|uniref:Exodeoxyribonuclease 7 large subunit (Modular protein) n=1 Tax=Cupriavidus neocaledonicus TaxID=1040979 RepID=A0A375H5Z3_9BURK|nr:Exodeoxyribonuclease 7 large subunit (modular protein) [Cupriavidus neocaledonicus]SPD45677.1 Exodeoxyribonuclease 7 large subunit (modular protein) [Cupriavidus neocaledonicus]
MAWTPSCSSPRASYIETTARTSTASPSRGWNSTCWLRPRNITQRICARASFSEKYQWPLAARVKFEISPRTQASGKLRSNTRAMAWLSSPTGITSRPLRGVVAEGSREKFGKSDMGKPPAGGGARTCPQHNCIVKGVALMPGRFPESRMDSCKPLILMRFMSTTKIRQYNHFSFASTTYMAGQALVHKVIHSFSG